jgi:hypothetical protein
MTDASPRQTETFLPPTPPIGANAKLKQIGPGLLAAATGVGAGDLVATMVAGAEYGTALLWAALLGTVLKLALGEGVGRWHLASGSTLLDGWRRLGRRATGFFGVYIVIRGFARRPCPRSGCRSTPCSVACPSATGR